MVCTCTPIIGVALCHGNKKKKIGANQQLLVFETDNNNFSEKKDFIVRSRHG
tara:strand:+ start:516 stop:671 length:156 start_codon:yes stop_codon:yes gene_type:complete